MNRYYFVSTMILSIGSMTLGSCAIKRNNRSKPVGITPQNTLTNELDPPQKKYNAAYGIKNFVQIQASLSAMTGVDPKNEKVTAITKEVLDQLPVDNKVSSVNGTAIFATTKLVTSYCEVALADPKLRSNLIGSFDLSLSPDQAFTQEGKQKINEAFLIKAMGPEITKSSDWNQLNQTLDQLTTQLLPGAASSEDGALGLCVAVMVSFGALHI